MRLTITGESDYHRLVEELELTEIAKLQLQQSVETYRVLMTLLVQICTVMVIADGTLIGFAIQQKLAGVIWAGLIFPVMMYLVIRLVQRLSLPVIATAVMIETKYNTCGMTGLMSLFVAVAISASMLEKLRSAAGLEDEMGRIEIFRDLERPRFSGPSPTKWGLLVVVVGQIIAPLVLHRFFGWNVFRLPN